MISLFTKTKDLVLKIDDFLDLTSQGGLHFKEGVHHYVEKKFDEFEKRLETLNETEKKADDIRKDIEAQLYVQTLIPESRGDVLGILESMDSIIDRAKSTLVDMSIEQPKLPKSILYTFEELTHSVVDTVEELVQAARAYFYEINAVKNHLHKVKFFEKEADKLAEEINRKIFAMKIDLSLKIQLRYFVRHIDNLADQAEEVSNRLAIASIKRIV